MAMPKASRLSSLPEALVQFCNKWLKVLGRGSLSATIEKVRDSKFSIVVAIVGLLLLLEDAASPCSTRTTWT